MDARRPLGGPDTRGFSLIEVMVATVIAVIAVLGLAYTFSAGRGLMDRYATARDALEAAERRLETLAMQSRRDPAAGDLGEGIHGPVGLTLNQSTPATETWNVTWVDDPVDDGAGDADPRDYKRVVVSVRWSQGGIQDSLTVSRAFPHP